MKKMLEKSGNFVRRKKVGTLSLKTSPRNLFIMYLWRRFSVFGRTMGDFASCEIEVAKEFGDCTNVTVKNVIHLSN